MKNVSKRKISLVIVGLLVCSLLLSVYCSKQEEVTHDEGSEESGTQFALNEKYDMIRNGARLILAYNTESNSFIGTVENTTGNTLEKVRVEVHLSNGTELGPTTPVNLEPGQKIDVKLAATSKQFEKWSAHPEVGSGEHGYEGEEGEGHDREGGEHDGKDRGEHDREGKGEHK